MIATTHKPKFDLFNPTESHLSLRESVSNFAEREMDLQATEHDEKETFNLPLFKRLGSELGLFGITIPEEAGGHGLDPLASVIVHEEMSRFDPAFTLSYPLRTKYFREIS